MEQIEAVPEQVKRYFNITRSIAVADLTPRGIGKGEGLMWLLEVLHNEFKMEIELENVLAIGDSWGDLPMLERAGIACAPVNAAPVAKDICDFVSDKEDSGAVTEAIEGAVAINCRLGVTSR